MMRRGAGLLLVLAACRTSPSPTPPPQASTGAPVASASAVPSASSAAPPPALPEDAGLPDAAEPLSPPRTIGTGARVVVVHRGSLAARRPTGQGPLLLLGPAPQNPSVKLSATVTPFLRRADVLDVTVLEQSEAGWHYERRETHYLVDTSGASDVLVCRFVGTDTHGGEYASSTTTIAVKRTAAKPLAFDVARTTTSRTTQPQPPSSSETKAVEHFVVGSGACTPSP